MVYVFQCPVCRKLYRHEVPDLPLCTGPSENRDDHELTVMHLVKVDRKEIHPDISGENTAPLIIQLGS